MGKKNKKIKYLCPHCGKKNKFAKNNWKGADKTKCKFCGKILARIKEYELPVTRIKKERTLIRTKETFEDIMGPALNLHKLPAKKKGWILLSIAIVFIIAVGFILDNQDKNTLDELSDLLNNSDLTPPMTAQELCSDITTVPSWIKDGEIIAIGYRPDWDITYLIENKIYFLYSSTCSACHEQISKLGNDWALYVASGYTYNCWA